MRTLLLNFLLCGLFIYSASGQYYPGGINYQAIARDNSGNELKNKHIDIRVSVISESSDGDIEYSETHSKTTDGYGLFSLVIGQGSHFAGKKSSLSEVNWGIAPHFLKVEVDFTGDGIFLDMSPMPFQAVPYALHAGTAANSMSSYNLQKLHYDPVNKILSLKENEGSNSIDLSGFVPNMSMSFVEGSLSLKGANDVLIGAVPINVNDADSDPTNEIQDLSISQDNKLKITRNPQATEVNLQPFLDNTDDQKLQVINDSLAITGLKGGNKVKIDLSDTNEIQGLLIRNDSLLIVKDPGATPVDLSKYKQSISLDGDNLSLQNGGTVDLSKYTQQLSLNEDILELENGGSANLSKYLNTDNQSLSIDGYQLTISGGNVVDIRPEVVAFRAVRTGGNPLASNDSIELKFQSATLNTKALDNPAIDVFDPSTGRFTVPQGGGGLYKFDISYHYENNFHSLRFKVNGITREVVFDFSEIIKSGFLSYNIVTNLSQGDVVSIFLKNTRSTSVNCQPAVFSGYRIH